MNTQDSLNVRPFTVFADRPRGPLPVHRHGLGQGGLCKEPVLLSLVDRLRSPEPMVLRIFVQEYYEMYVDDGVYNWTILDESITSIRQCGAEPLLALCMKPKALYPEINQKIVHPNDYGKWQRFVTAMVKHYNEELKWKVIYWEVFNEPDIGEDGGCPGLFEPEDYCIYYEKTVEAVLCADPHVKVGGPALASFESPLLPALLDHCVNKGLRLDFISWHLYTESQERMIQSIAHVQSLLDRYPNIHCETMINEWNIPHWEEVGQQALRYSTARCAYMLAMVNIFLQMGLNRSNFYHIKDTSCAIDQFAPWFSKEGLEHMDKFWNRLEEPEGGLFDASNRPRAHYYAYRLLQVMDGDWLDATGGGLCSDANVLAVKQGETLRLLVWNYNFQSPQALNIVLNIGGLIGNSYVASIQTLDEVTLEWVMKNDELPVWELPLSQAGNTATLSLIALPFGVYMVELRKSNLT